MGIPKLSKHCMASECGHPILEDGQVPGGFLQTIVSDQTAYTNEKQRRGEVWHSDGSKLTVNTSHGEYRAYLFVHASQVLASA